jgi:hypothetical protein
MTPQPSENPGYRQHQKGSQYTVEEQKIIEPFKDAFRSQESKAARLQILKTDILPAMFNYWASIEMAPMNPEESCTRAKVGYHPIQCCIIDHIARN